MLLRKSSSGTPFAYLEGLSYTHARYIGIFEYFRKVIALSMAGDPLWISEPLDGAAKGSPVISDDGNFIFLTHNAELNTVGYFSSLWAPGDGAVYYSQKNDTTPFAPLGIFHSPIEGNYDSDEGRGNTNDMIMWAQSPHPEDTTIMVRS